MVMKKYIIFDVQGGMGKNIMATAVVSALKKQYSDYEIVVVCGWPAVWLNNPNVYRVYGFGNVPYFYDDFIRGNDILVFKHEPYHHQDYMLKKRHLIEVWCEQCGVRHQGETPEIYYNWREDKYISGLMGNDPYTVIQCSGGTNNPSKYSWVRDIPFRQAQSIVDYLNVQGKKVIQLKEKEAPQLENVYPFETENIRDLFGVIKFSENRILIDSYSQHVAACFGLKSTVLWPVDNSQILGYGFHNNINSSVNKHMTHKIDSYLLEDNITGTFHECPFESPDVFNLEEVYKAINE
jgi:hypothetical protein